MRRPALSTEPPRVSWTLGVRVSTGVVETSHHEPTDDRDRHPHQRVDQSRLCRMETASGGPAGSTTASVVNMACQREDSPTVATVATTAARPRAAITAEGDPATMAVPSRHGLRRPSASVRVDRRAGGQRLPVLTVSHCWSRSNGRHTRCPLGESRLWQAACTSVDGATGPSRPDWRQEGLPRARASTQPTDEARPSELQPTPKQSWSCERSEQLQCVRRAHVNCRRWTSARPRRAGCTARRRRRWSAASRRRGCRCTTRPSTGSTTSGRCT